MIAVIVPVHDEEELLHACLQALAVSNGRHAADTGVEVQTFVVLDACTDGSKGIAQAFDVIILECAHRSVGAARALGAQSALAAGATWLAFTDGDTHVAADWLSCQLALDSDAVCGTIGVYWTPDMDTARRDFETNYQDSDDHRHIHGANFGISACAYREVGGFSSRACHEDVAIVKSLIEAGRRIAWSASPRVMTSARVNGRAPSGFAAALDGQMRAASGSAITAQAVKRTIPSAEERLARSFSVLESHAPEPVMAQAIA